MAITLTLGRIAWLIGGGIFNAFAAAGAAWYIFSTSLTGFNTSQQTLATQMTTLQASLNSVQGITNEQLAEARGNLAGEIGKLSSVIADLDNELGTRLEENSRQVAALNATLAGVDKRLSDSIARQQAFETAVMQRIIVEGPIQKSSYDKAGILWKDAGVDISPFTSMKEGDPVRSWASYTLMPPK